MSSILGKIWEKVTDTIDKITGAKKANNSTTTAMPDSVKNTYNQPDSISAIIGTAQALIGGIDSNYYPRISGNNKLKGVLFTKLIDETNAIIDEANMEKKKMINNS